MVKNTHSITQLLIENRDSNGQALERLLPLVQSELNRLAAAYLRKERPGHTLEPNALVNEACLSLMKQVPPD